MNCGFIKLNRGPDLDDLLRDPFAYALLTQVAARARRLKGHGVDGLGIGEALIGDYKTIGMTRAIYRTCLKRLEKARFLTIKTTNKGTIARLTDTRIFDINANEDNQQSSHQATIKQPSNNHQITTNKKEKKDKNEEREEVTFSSIKDAVAFFGARGEFPDVSNQEISL